MRDPEKMLEFKTKLLNIFVSAGTKVWISQNLARSLADPGFDIDSLSGRPPTMVSLDLSVSDDLSAVNYMYYSKVLKKFYSWTDYYIPEKTLEEHPNAELYKYWISKGYLKVCPGAVIDDSMIVTDILNRNKKLWILQIGYDSYKSQEIVNSLGAAFACIGRNPEKVLKAVPQTFGAFTSPVETFEMAAKKKPAGIVLADNKTVCTISVIHSQIQDAEAVIHMLTSELGLDEAQVRKRVEKVSSIERIQTNVSKETGDKIREYNMAGVKVDEDYKRYLSLIHI